MESVLRGIAIYITLLVILRLSGRRTLSQMTPFDVVLLLIVAETTQQALLGDDFSLANAIVLILTQHATWFDVAAAWVFLAGRLIHAWVQCSGDDVKLRGRVFVVNFRGVLWLMGHALLAILGGP